MGIATLKEDMVLPLSNTAALQGQEQCWHFIPGVCSISGSSLVLNPRFCVGA
jgi:hypothetical protein